MFTRLSNQIGSHKSIASFVCSLNMISYIQLSRYQLISMTFIMTLCYFVSCDWRLKLNHKILDAWLTDFKKLLTKIIKNEIFTIELLNLRAAKHFQTFFTANLLAIGYFQNFLIVSDFWMTLKIQDRCFSSLKKKENKPAHAKNSDSEGKPCCFMQIVVHSAACSMKWSPQTVSLFKHCERDLNISSANGKTPIFDGKQEIGNPAQKRKMAMLGKQTGTVKAEFSKINSVFTF